MNDDYAHPDCCCPQCCACWDDGSFAEPFDHTHPVAAGKSSLMGRLGLSVTWLDLTSSNPEDLSGLPFREG